MSLFGLPLDEYDRPVPVDDWTTMMRAATDALPAQQRLYEQMQPVCTPPSCPVGGDPFVLVQRGLDAVSAMSPWPIGKAPAPNSGEAGSTPVGDSEE